MSPHALRATPATNALGYGAAISTRMRLLGAYEPMSGADFQFTHQGHKVSFNFLWRSRKVRPGDFSPLWGASLDLVFRFESRTPIGVDLDCKNVANARHGVARCFCWLVFGL